MSPISTTGELKRALRQAGDLLQEAQDYMGRAGPDVARLRFPRGFIRTASDRRKTFSFVRRLAVRNNIAYTLMLFDVYLWLLRRTDLAGTAQDMVVKATLATAGSVAEALVTDHYAGVMGRRQSFKARTRRLLADGTISDKLRQELDWLWDMRCRQHLFELVGNEFDFYTVADHSRAVRALGKLIEALQQAYAALEPAF